MTAPAPKSLRAQLASEIQAEKHELAWRAVGEIEKLLKNSPDDPELHDMLGRAWCVLGDAAASEAAHRRSIQLEANSSWHWFNFAVSLWKLGGQTHAIDTMRHATEFNSTDDTPSFYLARWYAAVDRPDLALPWIERSAKASPGPSRLVWLALIQNELGDITAAQESLRRAFSTFAAERFTDWQPSSEAAFVAFVTFVGSPKIAGDWGRCRVEKIVNGEGLGLRPIESNPELAKLRAIGDLEDPVTRDELNAEGAWATFEDVFPLAADAISRGIGETWPAEAE